MASASPSFAAATQALYNTAVPSSPAVGPTNSAARNEAIAWKSIVIAHKVTLEHAAVDIDTDRVLYHMELTFATPLPADVLQHTEFLCLTWPYGGLWKIEKVMDNNTKVKCLSWRKTDLTPHQVEELAKQVDALAKKVEEDERTAVAKEAAEALLEAASPSPDTTPPPDLDDLPTLFEWKMMRGEWDEDVSHWFIRNVDPPGVVETPMSKRDLIAKLFVDFDPLEARIDVNALTAVDTVAQTYSADVTWHVSLPAITALREDAAMREFLDILEIDPSVFEFTNISDMSDERDLMSSVTPAGEIQFRDLTLPGDTRHMEDVYNLQFSRRVIATFTEEMALHSFPFDQQKLAFDFTTGNGGLANPFLRLTPAPVEPGTFSIENYQLANVFDVAYHNKVFVSYINESGPKKSVSFEMVLERRSMYYITNVAIIAAVITYLSFVTYAPVDDDGALMDVGSRLQIVTALVLTAVTFKNQVAELIPQVTYFTTLDKYVFFCFMVTSVVTIENALFPLYKRVFTGGNGSERSLLGFSIGVFSLVNLVWSLYLRWWHQRRAKCMRVLLQVHEYIRVITQTVPPKYREDVLRRFLKHKNIDEWCMPTFVVTSNGDIHIQAPDDVPNEDTATKAKRAEEINVQKHEAMSEQILFKKIYLDLRPGLDRRASEPLAGSPANHDVFTGAQPKKAITRTQSGSANSSTPVGRRSHSAGTYFHETTVDVHPYRHFGNEPNKRRSTKRAMV